MADSCHGLAAATGVASPATATEDRSLHERLGPVQAATRHLADPRRVQGQVRVGVERALICVRQGPALLPSGQHAPVGVNALERHRSAVPRPLGQVQVGRDVDDQLGPLGRALHQQTVLGLVLTAATAPRHGDYHQRDRDGQQHRERHEARTRGTVHRSGHGGHRSPRREALGGPGTIPQPVPTIAPVRRVSGARA